MIIKNAADTPLNAQSGTTPDVSGSFLNYFQLMTFSVVTKTVGANFQVIETANAINFQGVIQPFTERQLMLKPEGERAWSWYWLHAEPSLVLNVDDVVVHNGVQTRVASRKNYVLYGYVEYHLVQDFIGAGP